MEHKLLKIEGKYYAIYENGKVIDVQKRKIKPASLNNHGYYKITFYNPKTKKNTTKYVHRLVGKLSFQTHKINHSSIIWTHAKQIIMSIIFLGVPMPRILNMHMIMESIVKNTKINSTLQTIRGFLRSL